MERMEAEDLISSLMVFMSFATRGFTRAKRLAVERYMRTFLRSLTRTELEVSFKCCTGTGSLDPDLAFKLDQASKGYDRYMARRGKSGV